MPSMPTALLSWKSVPRNTLRGFADVRIGKSLIIRDVSVHTANGARWASAPSKPVIQDGRVVVDDRGKPKYVPIVEWADKESREAFSEGVLAAVEREHPGATSSDAA